MRKRRVTLILLATVIAGILYFILRPSEPSYEGKSLSHWIRGLEYMNVRPTEKQRTALRAMGNPAVTRLIALLQYRDSAIKKKIVAYAERHADVHNRFIAPRHIIPEDIYHAQAATALGEIGPAAQAAIPVLTIASTNGDRYISARAKAALIKIRQESIIPLLVTLADTTSTNWTRVTLTTKHLGTSGEAAVPLLVNALQSTNEAVQQYALWALQGIASRPDITVPALIDFLRSKDAGLRRNAIDALCEFKEAKPQIVPLLLLRMQDTDNNVWLGAAFGLENLLSKEEIRTLYVPTLVNSLQNSNETIRANAEIFLKRVDPEAATKAGIK